MTMETLITALLPSLCVSLFMAYFTRKKTRQDAQTREHAEARKRESLLQLDLQMATAKLSYATAMAMKRGKANGEVEEGVVAYEAAKAKYHNFLNEQAAEHLNN